MDKRVPLGMQGNHSIHMEISLLHAQIVYVFLGVFFWSRGKSHTSQG